MQESQIIQARWVEPALPQAAEQYVPIVARVPIAIRAATRADLPFIDSLQKKHSKELGFLPLKALEGKIDAGEVLVADHEPHASASGSPLPHGCGSLDRLAGYLIAADRYQKRDELGYIVQLCIVPEYRRSLVAAQLLQAQFDRSAYGCRLYCCWCAQDLNANAFWEAMGFTAIAFRSGGSGRGRRSEVGTKAPRVHIFWQKRIRAGDTGDLARGGTPFWYPSTTGSGQIREDRLVFPIPCAQGNPSQRVHWSEVMPIEIEPTGPWTGALPAPRPRRQKLVKQLVTPRVRGGMWFAHEGVWETVGPDGRRVKETAKRGQATPKQEAAKVKREAAKPKREGAKVDPRLKAMARELRDRWGERGTIAANGGKHDVKRIALGMAAPVQTRLPEAA